MIFKVNGRKSFFFFFFYYCESCVFHLQGEWQQQSSTMRSDTLLCVMKATMLTSHWEATHSEKTLPVVKSNFEKAAVFYVRLAKNKKKSLKVTKTSFRATQFFGKGGLFRQRIKKKKSMIVANTVLKDEKNKTDLISTL